MLPDLLVSVRNPDEARAALQGGATIIDIKDPGAGSLGMLPLPGLSALLRFLADETPDSGVSAALGELPDWVDEADSGSAESLRALIRSFGSLQWLKVGLSRTSLDGRFPAEWLELWTRLQHRMREGRDSSDPSRGVPCWVAVAYADWQRSQSPQPAAVFHAARTAGCPVLLVDTWGKDASGLWDWISPEALRELRHDCRAAGMRLAVAGRVLESLLPALVGVQPDIIAVRGAVCADGDRGATVCRERVASFRAAMTAAFAVEQHRNCSAAAGG